MAPKTLNNAKILDIFKNMDLQSTPIDTSLAEKWLYDHYPLEENTIKVIFDEEKKPIYYPLINQSDLGKEIYEKLQENDLWKKTTRNIKTGSLYKFSNEIGSNAEMLCQLEVLIRNILPKDTKKTGLLQLQDYLKYYSNWIDEEFDDNNNFVLCSLNEFYSLAEIGYFLGSTLSKGYNIVFYGTTSFILVLDYLIELSIKAGIPKGTITTLYGKDDTLFSLCPLQIHKNIKLNHQESFNGKKVLITPHFKSSMVIFNDADLDSACETTITAIWSSSGLLPWTVDTVLIQEDIFETFINKLKTRLNKLQFKDKPTKSDDISFYKDPKWKESLDVMIKEAKSQGIEIFQPKDGANKKHFIPTLFIGGKVGGNKVMSQHEFKIPTGTCVAFRTPKEAAQLANNCPQGLAVSIWSQNSSLINEVVRKIDVGTVWVNCYGIIKANVGFTSKKYDGVGYIGGNEGFYEFEDLTQFENTQETKSSGILSSSKKAQEAWNKSSFNSRVEKLSKFIQNSSSIKSKWTDVFYKLIKELSNVNSTQTVDNFDLKTFREAIGVVIVNKSDENVPDIVLGALLLGNSVLVVENDQFKEDINQLAKLLPSGILGNVSSSELGALEVLKQSVVVIGREKPFRRSINCQKIYDFSGKGDVFKFILRRCMINKNVWMDIGDSF